LKVEEIRNQVQLIFRKILEQPELLLSEELTANDVDAWDSLNHVALSRAVEEHFSIEINFMELMGLQKVGDLLELIESKV